MVPSIKKLRRLAQKEDDDNVWYNKLVRVFSIYLTWFFLHIKGFTPIQGTLLGLSTGLMAAGFFATGNYHYGLFGGLLVFLSGCFDGVDGETARYKKMSSIEGHHYDALVGHLVDILFLFGIVYGSFIKTNSYFVLGIGLILLVSFTMYEILVNLRYATYNYYSYHYKRKLSGSRKRNNPSKKCTQSDQKPALLMRILNSFSKLMFLYQYSFRHSFMIILAIIGKLEYFVYFYALIHPPFLVVNMIYQYYGGLKAFFKRTEHYQETGEVTTFSDT